MTCPLFVELCAGTAAVSLRLHGGPHARPPVSRMGAKTGYAHAILHALGLRQGQGHADGTRYLWCEPDAGVRLLLHAYTDRDLAQAAAKIIRSWKDEDPRALWERLRAEGPAVCPDVGMYAREVARWVLGGVWSYRQGQVESGFIGPGQRRQDTAATATATAVERVAMGIPATIRTDARTVDPREVARWVYVGGMAYEQGSLDSGFCKSGGGRWPDKPRDLEMFSRRLDTSPTIPATIHDDARTIEPARLPPGTVCYIDPSYVGTTGYANDLGRPEVVKLAQRWADAGALVCVSEAEPIPELVAEGWHALDITDTRKGQKRTFSKQQREWLTMSEAPKWRPSVARDLFGNR